ncbi:IniB N-terminal domain-containing protein [Pseudonocardia nigra]|uniref:IniB N-terminal domain-containing protein n=1 Tax=Pseudonocardia nigra TaxID=1921578 RepID=UPI001C5E0A93|nr:IniB N-terminal domain-containing protein [Pseudonocardia nigra]
MAQPLSLLEFLRALLDTDDLRADFAADPTGTLAAHGLGELSPADVHDALVLAEDSRTVDFGRDHLTGAFTADPVPSPPPVPGAGDDHHGAAVEYLASYVAGRSDDAADLDRWVDVDTAVRSDAGAWGSARSWSTADDDTASSETFAFGSGDPGQDAIGADAIFPAAIDGGAPGWTEPTTGGDPADEAHPDDAEPDVDDIEADHHDDLGTDADDLGF